MRISLSPINIKSIGETIQYFFTELPVNNGSVTRIHLILVGAGYQQGHLVKKKRMSLLIKEVIILIPPLYCLKNSANISY